MNLLILALGANTGVDNRINRHLESKEGESEMRELNYEKARRRQRAHSASMREIIAGFCRTALVDYREAGYPFGKSVDGLLIWFEYGQKTTDN